MKQTADAQCVEKGYSPNRSMLCVRICLIPAQNMLFVLGENGMAFQTSGPSWLSPLPPGMVSPTLSCLWEWQQHSDTSFLQPPLKPTMPSRPIAPAPPSTLSAPTKVPGQVTVTMESSIPQAPTIPVATISGQQVCAFCCNHCKVGAVQHWHSRSSS